jgi:SAM-dependent methyltransferase
MQSSKTEKPAYGNWVSTKFIYVPGAIGLVWLGLALFTPFLLIVALLFLFIAGYFIYARWRFSPAGGDVQAQIRALVPAYLDWDGQGKAVDIGCGSAALTIKLAQKYPAAQITGVDYWGGAWGYSMSVCEENARMEGVAAQMSFQKASASALPFEDGYFDAAVSNLTFHEVRDTPDKRKVLQEALRVVKKGGKFAFQDLFQEKHIYGEMDDLLAAVKRWGVTKVTFVETGDAPFIPNALKLPFMVGPLGILYGEK